MTKGKNGFIWFIVISAFVLGAFFLFTNDTGVIRYMRLSKQLDTLQQTQKNIEAQNVQLEGSIDSLQNKVPAKIGKLARERYNMKKPNETIIPVEEK
jgi:cell division protein FtsB